MSHPAKLDTAPEVWVGCLACYAAGRLTGDWFDATTADFVTPEQLHGGPTSHEEFWVFDHEGLPVTGELSPYAAARLARRVTELDEHLRDPFRAWVLHGDVVEDCEGLPVIADFEERYAGDWDTFEDYAHQFAEDVALIDGVPEELARYFDWQAWVRDLAMDYSIVDAPQSGVYVFRSL